MNLSEGFKIQSKKVRLKLIQLPCYSILAIPPKAIEETGIAHSACPHLDDYSGDIMGRDLVPDEDTEHQLIVGGGSQFQVKNTRLLIYLPADKESGVWRHPSVVELSSPVWARHPVTLNLPQVYSIDILQIRVYRHNGRIGKGCGDIGNDAVVSIDIVRVKDTDDLAFGDLYTFVHSVVDAIVFTGNQFRHMRKRSHDIECGVFGTAVDNDMFDIRMLLCRDRVERIADGRGAIVRSRDDRYLQFIVLFFTGMAGLPLYSM